jgi:hypothetical protein
MKTEKQKQNQIKSINDRLKENQKLLKEQKKDKVITLVKLTIYILI